MNESFDEIVLRVRKAASLLIVTHARPDGDGLGSMAALAATGRRAGKRVATLVPDKVPERYAFLFAGEMPAPESEFERLADGADLIVIVDTCSFAQLDQLGPALRTRRDKIVVVDHHATADDVGSVQWLDSSAAAAGVMVAEIIEALGWPLETNQGMDPAIALATAITSDTGWLRFANTDARCLGVMGRLIDVGVRPDKLYAQLFQCDRPQRLRLIARMLSTLELHFDDRLAVMCIRQADFAASGALPEETENLVNEALRIGCVESAVLLVETGTQVRVSLRSRDAIDVAAVAKGFGGGGHARAAGVRSNLPIDVIKSMLVQAFGEQFARLAK